MNVENWSGLSSTYISHLESVDKLCNSKFLNTPVTTPREAMYLELELMSLNTTIKARRVNFLHYLVTRSESEMIYKVFIQQWHRPVKNDWTTAVRQDLKDFHMEENLENIKTKYQEVFKKQVKQKVQIYEFNQLMSAKQRHTKMDNLNYSKLEIQEYFKLENMNTAGAQTLFKYRVRMANFSENFCGNQGPLLFHYVVIIWTVNK